MCNQAGLGLSSNKRLPKPQAQAELAELTAYANEKHGISQLEAWDYTYYSEKLKQEKYAISDEILRPYFPEDKVLNGLFETVNRLFGINVKEVQGVDTWHKDVRFFEIFDNFFICLSFITFFDLFEYLNFFSCNNLHFKT